AEGDCLYRVVELPPLPIAPHGPATPREQGFRLGRRGQAVADEVRLAAIADAGQSSCVAGGSATRAFERPGRGFRHGHAIDRGSAPPACSRTRAATQSRPASRSSRPRASRIARADRKSTRLNSSHDQISYAVFCLKKKKK